MSLSGRDPFPDVDLSNLFGDQDFGLFGSGSGGSRLPYTTNNNNKGHINSHRRMPQHNALELGARRLPRPRRRRKKRKPEESLYPSLSAIEGCVPDTAALDFGVSTSYFPSVSKIDTDFPPSFNSDTSSCSSSSSSQASSCSSPSGLRRHPSKSYYDDEALGPLVAPRRSVNRGLQDPSSRYSSKSSALSVGSFANRSVCSSSSAGSRHVGAGTSSRRR